ncbi:uncharacterized protein si:ch211-199g17.2 [Trichomycterus rosablanca]|uniref:uncharacterized protein si:ch211-199g17.2 n=1 Tax=Trichomycterus rosablanca TaxID=2290929 RepID=UPI002F35E16F
MSRSIHQRHVAPQTVQELTYALIQVWEEIPQENIRRLIRSMPRRCREVIQGAARLASVKCPEKSYTHYSYSFHEEIFHVASQAQKQSPPGEIQSVHLDFKDFRNVNSLNYANALSKLQQIRKESNKAEVKVTVTPGEQSLIAPEAHVLSESTTTTVVSTVHQKGKAQVDSTTQKKDDQHCKILCLECDKTFINILDYKEHVNENEHQQKLVKLFGPGMFSGLISEIKLYQYLWSHRNKPSPSPLIGLSLLTVFVHRQNRGSTLAFYMCHACEINIPVTSACTHLWSTQHYYHVFAYKRPDHVFLGSRNLNQITEFAKEEEKLENNTVLQVCDLPTDHFGMFRTLPYEKVMGRIRKLKLSKYIQVEKRVTLQAFSKSCDRKSSVVGLQFMVKYAIKNPYSKCGYLCLLCEKMLPERHAIVHILSTSHVVAYLNLAHPGSLSREEAEQMSLVTDLAQQAEKLSPNVDFREVELSFEKFHPVERGSYQTATGILQSVLSEQGLGELKPSVVPGAKLVPSSKKNGQEISQCETQDSNPAMADTMQNLDTTCTETFIPKLDNTDCQENGSQCKIQGSNHTMSVSEQIGSDAKCSETSITETDDDKAIDMDIDLDVCSELIHTEETDKLEATVLPDIHHTCLTMASSQQAAPLPPTQQSGPQDIIPEPESNPAVILPPHTSETFTTLEKPEPQCAKPTQKPTEVDADSKMTPPPPELNTETQAVPKCVTPPESTKLWSYLKKVNRKPVIGLKSVIECHTDDQPPFYMCLTCADRFDENSIVTHLTGHDHQHMYLKSINYAHLQHKKKVKPNWLRGQAILIERSQGYGEAEVLELGPTEYHEILRSPIITALGKLRECLLELTADINSQSPGSACSDEIERPETLKSQTEEVDSAHHQQESVISSEPDITPKQGVQRVNAVASLSASHTGTDDPAQSSPHLWSYLTSSSRTEPVIGLSVITEYRSSTGQNSFLCSSCEVILATSNYMSHLVSPEHRFNYIKSKHPELVALWSDEINLTCKSTELKVKAQMLQDIEGCGCLKVVEKESPKNKQHPTENAEISSKPHKPEPLQTSVTNISTEQQDQNHKRLNPARELDKKNNILIGLSYVTCVSHGKKKLFFCELCSVRCHLDHMTSEAHRKTYVESNYPGYQYPSGADMKMMLYKRLAAVEKITGMRMKKINVNSKIFTALRTAPLSQALSQLKSLKAQLEAGVDLNAIAVSPQHKPDAVSDHQNGNYGT